MEVILLKNVDKLGYTNEVVTVKPGYGRNFLIPQGYAILATASAKKAHAEIMRQKSHKESKMLAEAQEMAAKLLEEGIYVIGFFFPVVAKGKARIRVQLSAAHEKEHLDKAIAAFIKVGKAIGVIK